MHSSIDGTIVIGTISDQPHVVVPHSLWKRDDEFGGVYRHLSFCGQVIFSEPVAEGTALQAVAVPRTRVPRVVLGFWASPVLVEPAAVVTAVVRVVAGLVDVMVDIRMAVWPLITVVNEAVVTTVAAGMAVATEVSLETLFCLSVLLAVESEFPGYSFQARMGTSYPLLLPAMYPPTAAPMIAATRTTAMTTRIQKTFGERPQIRLGFCASDPCTPVFCA